MDSPLSPPIDAELDLDLDVDRFLLPSSHDHLLDSSSSGSPAPLNDARAHPPPRHRRCLFAAPPGPPAAVLPPPSATSKGRRRGSYNCGRCGQPKRGHVCPDEPTPASTPEKAQPKRRPAEQHAVSLAQEEKTPVAHSSGSLAPCTPQGMMDRCHKRRKESSASAPTRFHRQSLSICLGAQQQPLSSTPASSCSSNERYRRALMAVSASVEASADADYASADSYALEIGARQEQGMPVACMVHIFSRLSPPDLVSASNVCRRWSQCAEYVWAAVRAANLSVSDSYGHPSQSDYLPLILRKCPNLKRLTLNVFSQLSDPMLQFIAILSPQLSSFEVALKTGGSTTVSGEGLKALLRHCSLLTSVKIEGCRKILEVELSSTRLQTLWLTGCDQLKYMFLNCPALSELCLDFLPSQGMSDVGVKTDNEHTDNLAVIMRNLGNTARGLERLHIASPWLQDRVVSAVLSSGLKSLRMLSFTFGSGITDNSVAAITTHCQNLELLDLSGSNITDMGLELICKSFSQSLSKLLVALCPKVSQGGLELAVAKLPLLQLLDCGRVMVGCDSSERGLKSGDNDQADSPSHTKHCCIGVLSLRHLHLKKLSLWGCSGLQVLKLECPELVDLNLTGCSNLKPEGLQLICPSLKDVYVGKCEEILLQEVQCQVEQALFDHEFPSSVWRQGDGSKRVYAPRITNSKVS